MRHLADAWDSTWKTDKIEVASSVLEVASPSQIGVK